VKRNIVLLCDRVDRSGGAESNLSRLVRALGDAGHDVAVFGRRVIEPGAFSVPATEVAWGADDEPPNEAAAREVGRIIEAHRPHAVIASNVFDAAVLTVARAAASFLIYRVHDHRVFCPQGDRKFPHFPQTCTAPMSETTCLPNALLRGCAAGLHPKTVRLLQWRQALQRVVVTADRCVVSSEFMARMCAANGVGRERIAVIPPPTEGERLTAPAPRPAADRVLFAGRLVRDKGLASLIRAVGRIPAARRPALAAAGAPTAESVSLPALADSLGVKLEMLGHLRPAALAAEMDRSTLVVVPSLWPEPFGLVGIEAHARGRPVVAYDTGGIAEWMGAGGTLVPCGDERALALAIVELFQPDRWLTTAVTALRQAAQYTMQGQTEKLVALIPVHGEEFEARCAR